jgi:hypothetical protein
MWKTIGVLRAKIAELESGDIDGFDDAHIDGYRLVLKEFERYDGGISESYLSGIRAAMDLADGVVE